MKWNIPVNAGTDAFRQDVVLDGLIYQLALRWNTRDRHWFLDIGVDDSVLLAGIKLNVSDDLFSQSRHIEGLPLGRLQVIDQDGLDRDPDETLFGERVMLVYDDAPV